MKKVIAVCAVGLAGCVSGGINYTGPQSHVVPNSNSITIAKSRDEVWSKAIPHLGKEFFVINTMDKSSGLINLSYSGNPEKYVDCGQLHFDVTNARGARAYDLAGSSHDQSYEFVANQRLFSAHRKMSLDGRVNLVFEQVDASHTRVTASTRYVVTKNFDYLMVGATIPAHSTDSIGSCRRAPVDRRTATCRTEPTASGRGRPLSVVRPYCLDRRQQLEREQGLSLRQRWRGDLASCV
jgi:hypothetical protein